jgi:hypothetical protein
MGESQNPTPKNLKIRKLPIHRMQNNQVEPVK